MTKALGFYYTTKLFYFIITIQFKFMIVLNMFSVIFLSACLATFVRYSFTTYTCRVVKIQFANNV